MNLQNPSEENLKYMLEKMSAKLDVANQIVFNPDGYDIEKYDDLKFMYDVIMQKDNFSTSEIHAFIDELRSVRKDT